MTGMQFIIKILGGLPILLLTLTAGAQSLYLPQGNKHAQVLDRLEIKMQTNPLLNVSTPKPLSRKLAVEAAETADSLAKIDQLQLSAVDRYNLQSLLMNNSEWVTGDKSRGQKKSLEHILPQQSQFLRI